MPLVVWDRLDQFMDGWARSIRRSAVKHLRLQFRSSSAAFVDVVEQGFDIESDSLGFDEALKVVEDLVVVGFVAPYVR